MNVQKQMPARVNAWLAQARQADGSPEDRDHRPNQVSLSGTPSLDEDRLIEAEAHFDDQGALQARLVVDAHEHPFYSNEITIRVRRQGDLEKVSLRSHHPTDPQFFDYRASYARDLKSGEIQDFCLRPGPPQGLELAAEIFSHRECQLTLAGSAVLGTVSGLCTAALTGLPAGTGALLGLALGSLGGFGFCVQQRAYGG
ncbi:hypothetical protein JST97_11365 [bacterium]|nr:hypothetical protein [bacterium]